MSRLILLLGLFIIGTPVFAQGLYWYDTPSGIGTGAALLKGGHFGSIVEVRAEPVNVGFIFTRARLVKGRRVEVANDLAISLGTSFVQGPTFGAIGLIVSLPVFDSPAGFGPHFGFAARFGSEGPFIQPALGGGFLFLPSAGTTVSSTTASLGFGVADEYFMFVVEPLVSLNFHTGTPTIGLAGSLIIPFRSASESR